MLFSCDEEDGVDFFVFRRAGEKKSLVSVKTYLSKLSAIAFVSCVTSKRSHVNYYKATSRMEIEGRPFVCDKAVKDVYQNEK